MGPPPPTMPVFGPMGPTMDNTEDEKKTIESINCLRMILLLLRTDGSLSIVSKSNRGFLSFYSRSLPSSCLAESLVQLLSLQRLQYTIYAMDFFSQGDKKGQLSVNHGFISQPTYQNPFEFVGLWHIRVVQQCA